MTHISMAVIPLSGNRRVTIWRSEPTLKKHYDNGDIFGCTIMNSQIPASQLADQLMKLERVSAVEVLDGNGHGVRLQK